jgi:hypothetical protein
MKIVTLMLATTAMITGNAYAGTAKFMGQGHISKPAEYVEVNVVVKAECYKDLAGARDAANSAANNVLTLFRSIIDPSNPKDAAYTNGGSTSKHSGHYISGSNILICANTFQKSIQITLLTTDLQGFEENFLKIEGEIYSSLSGAVPTTETPVVTGVLATPVAHLFSETVVEVERLALKEALKNARHEFGIIAEAGCGVSGVRISSAVEPSNAESLPNPYAGTRGVPPQGNPTGAPVIFADIWITKALEVIFEFEGGVCGENIDIARLR